LRRGTGRQSDDPGTPAAPTPRSRARERGVINALHEHPRPVCLPAIDHIDMLEDDDAQLALTCCYELHYESFAHVDDRWEWAPELLAVRNRLERAFVERLEDEVGAQRSVPAHDVIPGLLELAKSDGPSLSRFIEDHGTIEQMREFCIHRSEYQRKEADPHTWVIPRLRGRAKAAAVTIQYDEYGAGSASGMHAELFADTMEALGLDPTYGAYRDLLPASTLATGNLVTMFGLHRRWRAACVGHLALFEMTSVSPMTRYSAALRRLGIGVSARRFYDVHVVADAWHEELAQHELIAGLLDAEPTLGGDVLFGARALMKVERRMTTTMLDAWAHDATSLLSAVPSRFARVLTVAQPQQGRGLDASTRLIPGTDRGQRLVAQPGVARVETE
jgi:Iron-containing redox enzyme